MPISSATVWIVEAGDTPLSRGDGSGEFTEIELAYTRIELAYTRYQPLWDAWSV